MCDESPGVIAPASPVPSPSGALVFLATDSGHYRAQRVTLIAEGSAVSGWPPAGYSSTSRLRYLVAEHDGHIAVFTLDEIHLVQPLQQTFRRNDSLCRLVEDPGLYSGLTPFSLYPAVR